MRRAEDFEPVLAAASQKRLDGLVMFTDVVTYEGWPRVPEFAARHRVATICEFEELADAGCLISYGPSFAEFTQRVILQLEKVLQGAKPADLPMEQAMRFPCW